MSDAPKTGMEWLMQNGPTIRDFCNDRLRYLPPEVRWIYSAAPDLYSALREIAECHECSGSQSREIAARALSDAAPESGK